MPRDRNLLDTLLDGRYELRSLLGEGAFGRVYLGLDRRLARIVAVKLIKPTWAEDPEWVKSFVGEARLLARLSAPGIVQIFDVGLAPEGPYYVAEFVDGESLASRLRRGQLAPREACDIAEQLCRALGHAHEQRIVHRDIKPANILISATAQVKIGDFGVARLTDSTTEAHGSAILGTPRYMSPEQANGGRATPAADVYSIGVVLYEMLAGRTPFAGESAVEVAMRHLNDSPPPLPEDVPEALRRVVVRALAKDPAQRYADGGAFARALARARPRATEGSHAAAASAGVADPLTTVTVAAGTVERRPAGADVSATSLTTVGAQASRIATPAAGGGLARPALRTGLATPSGGADGAPSTPARARLGNVRTDRARAAMLPPRRPGHIEETRIATDRPPARDATRAARVPSRLALALLAAGLIAAATLAVRAVTAPALVRVPNLRGLSGRAMLASVRRSGLKAHTSRRYSSDPVGIVIAQTPAAWARAASGSVVQVVISRGAPPVEVPRVSGQSTASARSILGSLHLRTVVQNVPAPGSAPGKVVGQDPVAGTYLPPHRVVALRVAEVPQWRTITTFAGTDAGASVPFQILGGKWRALYSMSYVGTCTFIIVCEGPNASIVRPSTHATIEQFGLGEGDGQSQVVNSGPGIYQIKIAPGMDTAQWSVDVQDYY
jgi:serine/threonine-protein kinase